MFETSVYLVDVVQIIHISVFYLRGSREFNVDHNWELKLQKPKI